MSKQIRVKIKWEKLGVDLAALESEAKSLGEKECFRLAQKNGWGIGLRSTVLYVLNHPSVKAAFMQYCKASKLAEIQTILGSGYELKIDYYSQLYGGIRSAVDFAQFLTLYAVTPSGGIGFCPYTRKWQVFGVTQTGLSEQEAVSRFMSNPCEYHTRKESWGMNLSGAVLHYCMNKPAAKLLINKKGELVFGESGGRIVFATPQAACGFVGYDPEEGNLHQCVDENIRRLIEKVRALPGLSHWGE